MGAKKDASPLIKCKCPKCKTEYEMRIFLFDHNPKRIYHKYCANCKQNVERISAEYDVGSTGSRAHTGIANEN